MNVFTYGSLIFPEVMEALTAQQFKYEDVVLSNFERRALVGKPYPGLIAKVGAIVEGRLWFDLDKSSIEILDQFEGARYERRTAVMDCPSQGQVTASFYVTPPALENTLTNEPWDVAHFKSRHLTRYVSMCRRFRQDVLKQG